MARILIVDDEPDILEFLQLLLEDEGYTVFIRDKAEHIEKLLNGELPDLILLDVLLSGKDGFAPLMPHAMPREQAAG